MKKIILMMVMAFATISANAQIATQNSKFFDNTYVGVAIGVETKAAKESFGSFKAFNPTATVIVGKNITPIFGVRVEGIARFNVHGSDFDKCEWIGTGKFVNAVDVNLLSTFNVGNLIAGYKGEPRTLEFIALYGFGWSHGFYGHHANAITSKAGVDVALNLGKQKQWQVFVEPSITYAMQGYGAWAGITPFQYNLNRANLELKAGLIYKFKTSNGTHSFKTYDIGAMNDEINNLKAELAKKPKEVVREVVREKIVTKVVDGAEHVVYFAQNSAELTNDAKATLDLVSGSVIVKGYASPEGTTAYNNELSQRRANVVAKYLRERGVTVNSAIGCGVKGNSSNRVAVVTVQ